MEVTVLERTPRDHQGCSHGNGGMVVPSHFTPLAAPGVVGQGMRMMWNRKSPFGFNFSLQPNLWRWVFQFMRSANSRHVNTCSPVLRDLHLASRAAYESLAEELGEGFGFSTCGLLMLCRDQSTFDAEAHVAEQANALGLRANVVTGRALEELDSAITMKAAGGVHFLDDCHFSPHAFMDGLRTHVEAQGVKIVYNAEVSSLNLAGSKLDAVHTAQGTFGGDEFVLAAGSWSERIAAQLKLRLPVQPGKGYSMTLAHPVQVPHLCLILTEARVAVTPISSTLRFAGTMEIGAGEHGINNQRVKGIIDSIPEFLPEFAKQDFSREPVWSGLRPCSPDGMPYVGRTQAIRNLTVATGHAMMGMSLGPITGKLVGEIICGESPSVSVNLLSPDRFA